MITTSVPTTAAELLRHRRRPRRALVGADRRRRRRHRPRPGLGRRRQLLGPPLPAARRHRQLPIDPPPGGARRPRSLLVRHRAPVPEAPHLYERVGTGTCSSPRAGPSAATRSRSPRPVAAGPLERYPGNPILSHRSTDEPCRTPATPTWWSRPTARRGWSSSASRPRDERPGLHVLGRERSPRSTGWTAGPWSAPSSWRWTADHPGPSIARSRVGGRDGFDGTALDPGWIALRRHPVERSPR